MSTPENPALRVSLDRRSFIRGAAAAASGIIILGPHAWAARTSSGTGSNKRLVVIFLRGAVDGLNVVVPYGDSEYYDNRPTIAIPRNGDASVINLDGHFGLNPALAPIMPMWRDGTLAFAHACGSPDSTRSHFDAQDYMESGTPGIKSTPDGWMNRVLARIPGEHPSIEAMSVGPVLPRIMSGAMRVANMPMGMAAGRPMPMDNPIIEGAFDRLYEEPGALTSAYMEGRAARKKLIADLKADMTAADNGAPPPDRLSQAASQLGRLIQHDPSVRLVFAGFGGWDTHVNQGAVSGQLTNHLKALGDGLATFINQLGSAYGETVILVISEFGRTVHENGNGGTDHGHGNVMWVMGGPVRGGRIYGQWPGLSRAGLYQERDLAITTDFREPIVRVLEGHLGLSSSDTARVFPNCPSDSGSVRGLLRV